MFETRVDFWTKKEFQAVDTRIRWEVDGIGLPRIIGETRVLQHPPMENEFQHERVRPEPAMRLVMRLLANAMVGKIRTEIIKERIFRAIGQKVKVEMGWELADVDPFVCAI